jgi:hypothetical protein
MLIVIATVFTLFVFCLLILSLINLLDKGCDNEI